MTSLSDGLYELELALARRDVASIPGGYDAVLDESFLELGSSGRVWARDEMLAALRSSHRSDAISIEGFTVAEITPEICLAMYVTVGARSSDGVRVRSRRSSIWLRHGERWRLRFHQGTPLVEDAAG